MHSTSCCDACTVLAARELQDVFAQAAFDHRVSSLVVLLVHRLIDRLTLPVQAPNAPDTRQARHTLLITIQDSQLVQVFGSEDACRGLQQGSRYWGVLAAVARHLQLTCGVAAWFQVRGTGQQDGCSGHRSASELERCSGQWGTGQQEGCSGQRGGEEQEGCSRQRDGEGLNGEGGSRQRGGEQQEQTGCDGQRGGEEQEQEQSAGCFSSSRSQAEASGQQETEHQHTRSPEQDTTGQRDGGLQQDRGRQEASHQDVIPSSQPEASPGPSPSPAPPMCPFCTAAAAGRGLALELSWHRHQRAAVASRCGALLAAWFPRHALAAGQHHPRPSSGLLEAQSPAVRQALTAAILGTQEQQLVAAMLQLQAQGQRPPPPPALDALGLPGCGSPAGDGGPIAAALAALPFLYRVEWKPSGRWEFQGSAFVTLTNGSGVFFCVCIRSVALVRTGGKARGLSLSWPGRFGQAARAGRGAPGQAEELAMKRRRQKRYGSAQGAVEYAAQLQQELPEGSRVFGGVYTSALEGVQVAAGKSRNKAAQAALLLLLLGLPAAWPEDADAPAEPGRCRRCGELMKGGKKQRGRQRGHRCRKRDRSWLGGSWWSSAAASGEGSQGSGYSQGAVLLAVGAAAAAAVLLYLAFVRRR